MKGKPVIFVALLVGVLGAGGLALASRAKPKGQNALPDRPAAISGPDPSLPPVKVGIVNSYAPVEYTTGGQIDYSYIPDGWLYAVIHKDW